MGSALGSGVRRGMRYAMRSPADSSDSDSGRPVRCFGKVINDAAKD
jgi:hypothetical protein